MMLILTIKNKYLFVSDRKKHITVTTYSILVYPKQSHMLAILPYLS